MRSRVFFFARPKDRILNIIIDNCVHILELLKNSIIQINKTALIDRFHETETDEELIFQQLYFRING
ncbi:hypothetical protein LBBP_03638 [Leptospira borgpetersenii serovar Ballum]|uniref:Uncharacterized protein n=1 Tax=Leptospira borgpetersenii serovar Ballum TaxID=280505 RepID=A0A0S2IVX8_LEPBO|nr:hypothetical protein LBBP_03638 [Leptospira borgpetersenii serovar Ballum]